MTELVTFVRCAAPLTCPQTIKLRSMFFRVRVANGWPTEVGEDMSTTQDCKLDSVPELVACAAEAGRIMC